MVKLPTQIISLKDCTCHICEERKSHPKLLIVDIEKRDWKSFLVVAKD